MLTVILMGVLTVLPMRTPCCAGNRSGALALVHGAVIRYVTLILAQDEGNVIGAYAGGTSISVSPKYSIAPSLVTPLSQSSYVDVTQGTARVLNAREVHDGLAACAGSLDLCDPCRIPLPPSRV